jgi:HD-like signal output (HDOD) protein
MAKRLLIVDDDADAAAGLAAALDLRSGGDWEIDIATSSLSALAQLKVRPADVVIASLRLGGGGGEGLLATIASQHPDVVRFGKTGDEPPAMLRSAVSAHQILGRETTPEQIVDRLRRTFALRDSLDSAELRAIVGHLSAVPTLPAVYTAVMTEIARPHASGRRIGELVADDPSMSAKLLQMVNSPFFGREMRVSDPAHAVQLLGLDAVRGLVVSAHVLDTFRKPARGLLDVERLWRHAVAVSAIAGGLAVGDRCAQDVVEMARTAGLLHDIGKLVLVATLPVVATRIMERARKEGRPCFELEREELGVTHAELGAYLLGLWHLPTPIVEVTAWHHSPPGFVSGASALSFVVAANVLDSASGPREGRGDPVPLTARLKTVLEPLGLAQHAGRWLDWTIESARPAA